MSNFIGRKAVLYKGSTPVAVAGVRTTGLTVNNTSVDITTNDDSGIRKLLAEAGEKQVDISISGLSDDLVFLEHAVNDSNMQDVYKLEFPPEADGNDTTGAKIEGTFNFTGFSMSGAYSDATTFDVTLNSSGVITFTAGTSA